MKKIWGKSYFDKKLLVDERTKQPEIPKEIKKSYSTKKIIMGKLGITENILKYWLKKLKPDTKLHNNKLYIKNNFLDTYTKAR